MAENTMTTLASSATQALARFRAIVGEAHAHPAGTPETDSVRDEYSPVYGTDGEPLPGGVVRPASVSEVQEVLRAANDTGTPLWVISRGRNYGYGGPAPVHSGTWVLDLRRMDQILEISEEQAYAVVEPGVSPEALWAEIERRGLNLWTDGASSPYGSIIGNALDRGVGYGLIADRVEALTGLEVVLPDGDLVRTGTGALSSSTTWSVHKHGFGPSYNGLFSQSNFGVVTKAGVTLIPRPPAFRHAEVYIADITELGAFIDILARARRAGTLQTGVSGGVNFGGHVDGGFLPGGGRPPQPGDKPGFRARLGFLGVEGSVDANWQAVHEELSALSSYTFNTRKYLAPYDYSSWGSEARLAAGIPSPLELPSWEGGVHYTLFASLIIPATGAAFEELTELAREIFAEFGRDFLAPTFHLHSPTSIVCLVGVPLKGTTLLFEGGDDIDNDESLRVVTEVIRRGAERGWLEYRTGTSHMEYTAELLDFNEGAWRRLGRRIKGALDPNGILSPGKSGL